MNFEGTTILNEEDDSKITASSSEGNIIIKSKKTRIKKSKKHAQEKIKKRGKKYGSKKSEK